MTSSSVPVHMRRVGFDPDAELARLRTGAKISRVTLFPGAEAWLVTRYHDVKAVLGDASRFSTRTGPGVNPLLSSQSDRSGFLLGYDPPDHTRLRKMLTAQFTVARMRRLRPRVEAVVTEHLDAMAAIGSPIDLMQSFALPIPSLVICELLGVPYADRDEFQSQSRARVDLSKGPDERTAAAEHTRRYLGELVARQRRTPGEDMLGTLVREHGDEVGEAELTGVADFLLMAGHETTANMLGLGVLLLLEQPDQLAMLRDPANVDTTVEELLRYLSVVHCCIPRMATEDVVIGDTTIAAGDLVICSFSAANRDPEMIGADVNLDRFDLTRGITSHVAFGYGMHRCLGAPLARMEMQIAYPSLFERFPGLRLDVPLDEVSFRSFALVFGLDALPVAW
ncbi:MAG: cytochrome P450 [Catenulispora sp.]